MKRFSFLVVALLVMTTSAFAQFTQSNNAVETKSSFNGGNFFSKMSTDDYSRLFVGYNPVSADWKDLESQIKKMIPMENGLTVGYMYGKNVLKSLPLYVEFGANVGWIFGKHDDNESEGDYKVTTENSLNMFSLNIPVNVAFRFSFNDNKVAVTPYLGLNFRFNMAGTLKSTTVMSYYDEYEDENYKATQILTQNLFSSEELDTEDEDAWDVDGDEYDSTMKASTGMGDMAFKRFQVGFNVGVAVDFKSLHLGIGYVTDFSPIANSEIGDFDFVCKLGVPTISLGVNF